MVSGGSSNGNIPATMSQLAPQDVTVYGNTEGKSALVIANVGGQKFGAYAPRALRTPEEGEPLGGVFLQIDPAENLQGSLFPPGREIIGGTIFSNVNPSYMYEPEDNWTMILKGTSRHSVQFGTRETENKLVDGWEIASNGLRSALTADGIVLLGKENADKMLQSAIVFINPNVAEALNIRTDWNYKEELLEALSYMAVLDAIIAQGLVSELGYAFDEAVELSREAGRLFKFKGWGGHVSNAYSIMRYLQQFTI